METILKDKCNIYDNGFIINKKANLEGWEKENIHGQMVGYMKEKLKDGKKECHWIMTFTDR